MYKFLGIHYSRWAWFLYPLSFFLRINIYPNVIEQSYFDEFKEKTIIYVLPKMSLIDIIVLNKTLRLLKQKIVKSEARPKKFRFAAMLAMKPRTIFFHNENKSGFVYDLMNLIKNDPRSHEDKIVFMPLSVFWSRAAEQEGQGFLLRSLFPDDGTGNGLQKLLMLILHRGEVNICFGKSLELNPPPFTEDQNSHEKRTEAEYHYVLKIKRLLHIEFAKERTAAFGPVLYDREKLTNWIMTSPSMKEIIDASENKWKTKKHIVQYIAEISARYNYMTIRALETIFDILWNKVFDGVKVRNFESIERYAKDGQIIWMPSHRSHFDYLLLSYVLFKKGLASPHIAAGINLNFWPIGSILRQGGAFFIRRSFAGNKVYANTFSEYVNFLLQNSFPIEFFHEGGRSRIGKLLTPKLGMLNICVQSIITRKAENTYFIPVYFGYDKVMEDDSYARELRGAKKQKENAFQFLNGIRKIFSNYGKVDVSFGEPLKIADVWEEYHLKLQKENQHDIDIESVIPKNMIDINDSQDSRDLKINGFVKFLSKRVNQKINSAATASCTALLSTALLANKGEVIEAQEMKTRIILLHWLANEFGNRLNWRIATNTNESNIFEYLLDKIHAQDEKASTLNYDTKSIEGLVDNYLQMGEKWKLVQLASPKDSLKKQFYKKNPEKEFNLWWYRGTIFHVYAAFSIVAFELMTPKLKGSPIVIDDIEKKVTYIRHLWQDELYWDNKTSNHSIVKTCLTIFEELKLVTLNENTVQVNLGENVEGIFNFLIDIAHPERDLFGLQAAAAIELMKLKHSFQRDELIQKTMSLHTKAYAQKIIHQQPIFSKIFSNRTFDAFFKHKVYVPAENLRMTLDTPLLSSVEEFLEVNKFLNLG